MEEIKKMNMKHLKAIVRGRRCAREFEVSPVTSEMN